MILQTNQRPAQLRDQVTSPGSSAIAGLVALEKVGFGAAVTAVVDQVFVGTKE